MKTVSQSVVTDSNSCQKDNTRSQAVARIAERNASQQTIRNIRQDIGNYYPDPI